MSGMELLSTTESSEGQAGWAPRPAPEGSRRRRSVRGQAGGGRPGGPQGRPQRVWQTSLSLIRPGAAAVCKNTELGTRKRGFNSWFGDQQISDSEQGLFWARLGAPLGPLVSRTRAARSALAGAASMPVAGSPCVGSTPPWVPGGAACSGFGSFPLCCFSPIFREPPSSFSNQLFF